MGGQIAQYRHFKLPAPAWLSGYQRPWLRVDVVAGLTAAAVVIPKAMTCVVIRRSPLGQALGDARMFHNLPRALETYLNEEKTGV